MRHPLHGRPVGAVAVSGDHDRDGHLVSEGDSRPIRLTEKEKKRAFHVPHWGRSYTIAVRRQANGQYMVAVVNLEGEIWSRPSYVESKDLVPKAVAAQVRWLDKMGMGGRGARASRERTCFQRYTADESNATFSLDEFERNNEGLPEEDVLAVASLLVGHSVTLGGGACATTTIRRIR